MNVDEVQARAFARPLPAKHGVAELTLGLGKVA